MAARAKTARPSASASAQATWKPEVASKLVEAVAQYDFASTPEWSELDQLSSHTQYEGLTVSPEGTVFDRGSFIAPGVVHVRLVYGTDDDVTEFSDSYPVRFFFRVTDPETGDISIDRVVVDVSSFYQ